MKSYIISVPSEMNVWFDLEIGDSATVNLPRKYLPGKNWENEISFTVIREQDNRLRITPFIGKAVSK